MTQQRQPKIIELSDVYTSTTPLFRFTISHDSTTVTLGPYMTVRFIGKASLDSDTTLFDSSCLIIDSTRGICECRLSLDHTATAINGIVAELRVDDHVLATSDVVQQYKLDILKSLGG